MEIAVCFIGGSFGQLQLELTAARSKWNVAWRVKSENQWNIITEMIQFITRFLVDLT